MKIIFFGSGKFAVRILETLHRAGFEIPLVITQPDRKKGRHLHIAGTPVKEYALAHKLHLLQPENISTLETVEKLKTMRSDLFIVVSYGRILPEAVLKIPRVMPVNIHASLLPKYRGAAPISRALMNGEGVTGITYIKMNTRMDQGDILFAHALRFGRSDNAATLDEKLANLASKYCAQLLEKIVTGRIRPKKQNDRKATYAALMTKQDGLVKWEDPPQKIINKYRGCFGWPGSFTFYKGKVLKILEMEKGGTFNRRGLPGEILKAKDNLLEVACCRGSVIIKEVLPESHKRMSVRSFLAGHAVKIGEKLGR